MLPKKTIIDLYDNGNGEKIASIARIYGVSRQRIDQVVKGYKNTGIASRKKLYKKAWKEVCQRCKNEPSVALHHKDGNNKNDVISNLISLGILCHANAHKELRRKNKIVFNCKVCGKEIISLFKLGKKDLCDNCIKYSRKLNHGKAHIREFQKSKICVTCKEPFSKEKPYRALNQCDRCYLNHLYKTSPKRREQQIKAARKYQKKRLAKDPAYRQHLLDYQKEYYNKKKRLQATSR